MASTCIHGFAPGTCLICQTLQGGSTTTKEAPNRNGSRRGRAPVPAPVPVRPDSVTAGRPERRGPGIGIRLIGFLVLALAVVIGVWIVAGFVLAVLHILELVGVAVVAAWAGWSLGVRHGRHSRT